MVGSDVARAREAPEEAKREQLEKNSSWTEEDATNNVTSLRDCDAEPVAEMLRYGLCYNLSVLVGSIRFLPYSSWVVRYEAQHSLSPSVRSSKTRCKAAGWRLSIPATACTAPDKVVRSFFAAVICLAKRFSAC